MGTSTVDRTPARAGWYDTRAVLQRLNETVSWPDGHSCSRIALRRVWPGARRTSCEWSLTVGGREVTLQGAVGDLGGRRLHSTALATDHGLADLRVADPVTGLYWCTPDRDPKLKHLRALLHDPEPFAAGVAGLGTSPTMELLAYRMHRRCVLRLRGAREVFVKVLRRLPDGAQRAALNTARTDVIERSAGALRIPDTLLWDAERRCIVTDGPVTARPCDVDAEVDLRQAAHAIAIIHSIPARTGTVHDADAELGIVRRWSRLLAAIDHPVASRFDAGVALLGHHGAEVAGPMGLVHRDYHEGQVLHSDGTMWLIDFDTLGQGHAEVDLATFAAHIVLDMLTRGQTQATALHRVRVFVDAYTSCGGAVEPARLRFYLASALLRLGAIHSVRRVPAAVIEALWDLSARALTPPGLDMT